ncbi:DUF7504 family protein [Natronoglomus mannanivorans]|uniref:Uncharacterized protein n=1 Tax=Natronoglomus mannanivorans TaxID=2979990 RepID=A0AAP2YY31_9EURY|nr:hypothetical protein [Halobacteria archaeon AArc-xg1-1]
MEPTTPDTIEPPANVLLVHAGCSEPDACQPLLESDEATAELRVSFSNERTDRTRGGETPAKLGLLSIGDVLRSASSDAGSSQSYTGPARNTGPDFGGPIAIDAVDDPQDLASIGLSISRFCEHWAADDGVERITVCFRSLDTALGYTSPKTVFQFVHVLTSRLSSVGATAHFHFDPTTYDDRIVATFGSIFDEVVCDDSVGNSLPEATDDEVAAVLEEWGEDVETPTEPADGGGFETPVAPRSEATDEDIARLLEQ